MFGLKIILYILLAFAFSILVRTTPKKSDSISLSNLPLDKLIAHMKVYKEQLYTQLRNTVLVTAKQVQNIFHQRKEQDV